MRISTGEVLPFELRGLTAVWAMPAADQAAIIPFMLSCSQVDEGRHMEGVTTETTRRCRSSTSATAAEPSASRRSDGRWSGHPTAHFCPQP